MLLHCARKELFLLLPENCQGNRSISAFSTALQAERLLSKKLIALTENQDESILVADEERKIPVLHNLQNFGGSRSCLANEVTAMIGLGATPIRVF
eukprot:13882744-Ditylum_brightwellii.AAC.1